MSVAVDVRQSGTFTAGALSISWTMTISGGLNNSILMVGATTGVLGGTTVSGVNWDDAGTPEALTFKGRFADTNGACAAEIWYRLNPTAGTKTIKVTASVSAELTGGGASYQGVDQATPFNAASPQTARGTA